jgi:hypothetical protein
MQTGEVDVRCSFANYYYINQVIKMPVEIIKTSLKGQSWSRTNTLEGISKEEKKKHVTQ